MVIILSAGEDLNRKGGRGKTEVFPRVVPQLSASEASGYSWRDPVISEPREEFQGIVADKRDPRKSFLSFAVRRFSGEIRQRAESETEGV